MYTRTFHCTDFEGNSFDVTYDFFMSKADLLKINFLDLTGLDALLKRLIDSNKGSEIMDLVDTIIMTSVGKESLDHKRFLQDESIKKDFRESEAYSQLFEELIFDSQKASEFINAIIPEKVKQDIARKQAEEAEAKKAE